MRRERVSPDFTSQLAGCWRATWFLRAGGPSVPIAWATAQRRPRSRSEKMHLQGHRPGRSAIHHPQRIFVLHLATNGRAIDTKHPANWCSHSFDGSIRRSTGAAHDRERLARWAVTSFSWMARTWLAAALWARLWKRMARWAARRGDGAMHHDAFMRRPGYSAEMQILAHAFVQRAIEIR